MRSEADRPLPLIIAGPSGSGKSALAIDLAEAMNGVVINADSMQLYRELRILTARPTPADEARVPHRLYGVLPAAEAGCVADWLTRVLAEMETARSAGRTPIIVGGSGLYLKALMCGLSPMPPIPADVRAEARALFAELGEAEFRRHLSRLDVAAATRLGDRQRLIRAYEVAAATGVTMSTWQRMAPPQPPLTGPTVAVALLPARPLLTSILDRRFDEMIASGAVAEVRALMALRLDPGLPAMKALGVAELAAYLCGETTLVAACAAAKAATRRYAKRQVTWLRHQMTDAIIFNEQYSERVSAQIRSFIRQQLLILSR